MRISFLSFVFCSYLLLGGMSVASAQEAATTSTSTDSAGGFFDTVIEGVQNIGETVQEQVSPSEQSPLSPRAQERLTNLAANISNRLDGLAARLENISGRLEERINKQAEDGYNVDAARSSLETAKTSLQAARNELKTIDRDVYKALHSTDPKTAWRDVRTTYITARDNIRIAHTGLRDTIINLKTASPTPTETASSTTEGTPSLE